MTSLTTTTPSKKTFQRPNIPSWQIWLARGVYISALYLGYLYYDALQHAVNISWEYIRSTWFFNSVYFETWWTSLVYLPIIAVPWAIDNVPLFRFLHRYKLDPSMTLPESTSKDLAWKTVEYWAPLMLLDTFMVKKYHGTGIDPAEWQWRAQTWIQHTRAMPTAPPTMFQIFWHLCVSMIIYDLLFFLVHYAVHKNGTLYRMLHKEHHTHSTVHSRVTNRLHVVERIALVLSANQALRILYAHPLTRAIFVPFFISWIVENHCGYDFPWTLDKVVPFGLVGGSPAHFVHHQFGERNYQPFFTYIDKYIIPVKPKASQE